MIFDDLSALRYQQRKEQTLDGYDMPRTVRSSWSCTIVIVPTVPTGSMIPTPRWSHPAEAALCQACLNLGLTSSSTRTRRGVSLGSIVPTPPFGLELSR